MPLAADQRLMLIAAIALGTMLTRFVPFVIFPEKKEIPKVVTYLGNTLPAAMIGLLVVYCLRNAPVSAYPFGLSELLSILMIVLLHQWKRNALLSIAGGTALYMFLVQVVF